MFAQYVTIQYKIKILEYNEILNLTLYQIGGWACGHPPALQQITIEAGC